MRIQHGRVALELHELARREGPALLLLHALFGSSVDWIEAPSAWPGSVYALDFSGHGRSDWVVGGAYSPELLLADADAALAHIGVAAVTGAGVGAYVALLLAGARPESVPAALLFPGAGLSGGGALPNFNREFPGFPTSTAAQPAEQRHDPMVGALNFDVRPSDYAEAFAHAARRLLLVEDAETQPPWWQTALQSPSAEPVTGNFTSALTRLLAAVGPA